MTLYLETEQQMQVGSLLHDQYVPKFLCPGFQSFSISCSCFLFSPHLQGCQLHEPFHSLPNEKLKMAVKFTSNLTDYCYQFCNCFLRRWDLLDKKVLFFKSRTKSVEIFDKLK